LGLLGSWSAATCRRFSSRRLVGEGKKGDKSPDYQSGDKSPHSKGGLRYNENANAGRASPVRPIEGQAGE